MTFNMRPGSQQAHQACGLEDSRRNQQVSWGEGWQSKCPRGGASKAGRVSRMGRAGILGKRVGRVGALEAQDNHRVAGIK